MSSRPSFHLALAFCVLVPLSLSGAGCVGFAAEPEPAGCSSDQDCAAGERCGPDAACVCIQNSWYEDLDGDGHGVEPPVLSCEPPEETGFVLWGDDCFDGDPHRYPGAETCGYPLGCGEELVGCSSNVDEGSRIVARDSGHDYNLGQGIGSGDLDGDGKVDLVLRSFASSGSDDDRRRLAIHFGPFPADGTERTRADVELDGPPDSFVGSKSFEVLDDLDGDGVDELFVSSIGPMAVLPQGEVRGYLLLGRDAASWSRLAAPLRAGELLAEPGVLPIVSSTTIRAIRAGDLDPSDSTSTRGLGLLAAGSVWLFDAAPCRAGEPCAPLDLTAGTVPGVSASIAVAAADKWESPGEARYDVTGDGAVDLVLLRGKDLVAPEVTDVLVLEGPFPRGAERELSAADPTDRSILRLAVIGADIGRGLLVRPVPELPAEIWVSDNTWKEPIDELTYGRIVVLRVIEGRLQEWGTIEPDLRTNRLGYTMSAPSDRTRALESFPADEVLLAGSDPPTRDVDLEGVVIRGPVLPGKNPLSSLARVRLRDVYQYGAIVGDLDGDGSRDYALSLYESDHLWLLFGAAGRF